MNDIEDLNYFKFYLFNESKRPNKKDKNVLVVNTSHGQKSVKSSLNKDIDIPSLPSNYEELFKDAMKKLEAETKKPTIRFGIRNLPNNQYNYEILDASLINSSKIGGIPYLPKSQDIPKNKENGEDMVMIAQINFDNFKKDNMSIIKNYPNKGLLQIWIANDFDWDTPACKVLYYDKIINDLNELTILEESKTTYNMNSHSVSDFLGIKRFSIWPYSANEYMIDANRTTIFNYFNKYIKLDADWYYVYNNYYENDTLEKIFNLINKYNWSNSNIKKMQGFNAFMGGHPFDFEYDIRYSDVDTSELLFAINGDLNDSLKFSSLQFIISPENLKKKSFDKVYCNINW